jgi:hypothetical protein
MRSREYIKNIIAMRKSYQMYRMLRAIPAHECLRYNVTAVYRDPFAPSAILLTEVIGLSARR